MPKHAPSGHETPPRSTTNWLKYTVLVATLLLTLFFAVVTCDERLSRQLDDVDITYEEYIDAYTIHGD